MNGHLYFGCLMRICYQNCCQYFALFLIFLLFMVVSSTQSKKPFKNICNLSTFILLFVINVKFGCSFNFLKMQQILRQVSAYKMKESNGFTGFVTRVINGYFQNNFRTLYHDGIKMQPQ